MKRILILMGRYLPGHKDGGPLRTIANVVDSLGDEYEFFIGCLDRDHGDTEPYPNIKKDAWNQVGKAKVWYEEPGGFTDELILRLADGKDSIYLSSFYENYGYKTLWLKRRGKIKIPIALASMGVFSSEALAKGSLKKKAFINLIKALGLFNGITWSVTSELEANDLKRVVGVDAQYIVAEDLPRSSIPGRNNHSHEGLQVAFLSRICAHKGLDIAIEALAGRECEFSVFGPIQEKDYWDECQKKMDNMDLNWSYQGDVPSDDVQKVLSDQDLFILPTKSENYGHVVFEALSVGCIPIISENTVWDGIADAKAGYVVKRDPVAFRMAFEQYCSMTRERRQNMSNNAVEYARKRRKQALDNTGYREIFNR